MINVCSFTHARLQKSKLTPLLKTWQKPAVCFGWTSASALNRFSSVAEKKIGRRSAGEVLLLLPVYERAAFFVCAGQNNKL